MDDLDLPEVPQGFAERFAAEAREPAELYLLSPPQIEADFADRLKAALDAGPIAAFQLRLKGLDDHAIARAAEPIQAICAERDVAFIVNDVAAFAVPPLPSDKAFNPSNISALPVVRTLDPLR